MALTSLTRDIVSWGLYTSRLTLPRDPRRLSIATFHRVLPGERLESYGLPRIAVTPEELAWFLDFFKQHFECGSLATVHETWRSGRARRPLLAITFDDGQRDNFVHAKPVLDDAGVKASFFIPTAAVQSHELLWHDRAAYAMRALAQRDLALAERRLAELGGVSCGNHAGLAPTAVTLLKPLPADEREAWIRSTQASLGGPEIPDWDGMMSLEQLRQLADEGHEVGSHSHTHAILTRLDAASLEKELTVSRSWLEGALGRRVGSLCYPNGDADVRVAQAAFDAGYERAVTTRFGDNDAHSDRFLLRRFDIQSATARARGGRLSAARLAWRMSRLHPGRLRP